MGSPDRTGQNAVEMPAIAGIRQTSPPGSGEGGPPDPPPGVTYSLVWTFNNGTLTADVGAMGVSGNAATVQAVVKRGGGYGMRTDLTRATSPVSYRTEITQSQNAGPPYAVEVWYGWSVYLPTPYANSNAYEIISQWHKNDNTYALNPIGSLHVAELATNHGGALGNLFINFIGDDRAQSVVTVNKDYQSKINYDLGPPLLGQWMDFVLGVTWDYRKAINGGIGRARFWINEVLKFDTGIGAQIGFVETPGPYFKMGLYKGWQDRTTPIDPVTARTLYHDELRIALTSNGGSYNAVAPSVMVGPRP